MSCSEVLSPRPVRPWMPIPSTSPPPYEEPFEDYEEPGPSPSPYQSSYHNSYHPSPRAGPSMLREPTVAADYPYNSRPQSRNSVHSRDPPQPSAFAASAYASRARAERNSSDVSIDHLREALNSLDSKMASLLNERDILESRLERAVRLHSPVHRLPSELLASIFTMGVMSIEEDDSLLLTTLMLVCRHWKEVALGTPLLWSRIVTGIHRPLSKAFRKLERSKSIPLHICVDFDPKVDNGTVTTDSIVRTMDLLRTSIWRWKSFRLTVPDRPQALAALMRCKDPAPLLEVLSIRVLRSIQEDHHHANPPRPIFQGQTPSLTSCSLTAFNFGWDMHLVSRLRVLKLGGYWNGYSPSVDTTLAILRACPHLEELVLRNMSDIESGICQDIEPDPSDYGERIPDAKMVQLPRLMKASFHYSGSLRTRAVLALLSCPALEDVELCFLDNVSPMIEHLRRQSLTFLPLRRLRIESSFFSELKLAKFLRRVPSLASLELVDVEDASPSFLKVSHQFCWSALVLMSNAEPSFSAYDADLGMSEVDQVELGGMHGSRLGNYSVGGRVAASSTLQGIFQTHFLHHCAFCRQTYIFRFCFSLLICFGSRGSRVLSPLDNFDVVCFRVRCQSAHSLARPCLDCEYWWRVGLAWCPSTSAIRRPHALPSGQQGDDSVVADVCR